MNTILDPEAGLLKKRYKKGQNLSSSMHGPEVQSEGLFGIVLAA